MNKCLLATLVCLANILLVSCADEQARVQLGDTNARLSSVEQNLGLLNTKVSNQKVLDILNKLENIQTQLNQLNGEISTLKQNQKNYQTKQEQLNTGFQDQIQAIVASSALAQQNQQKNKIEYDTGSGNTTATDNSEKISSSKTSTVRDRKLLNLALKKLKAHDFNSAIKQLKAIIVNSKDQQILVKANYYLAVSYVANKQYKSAIAISKKFVDANPDDIHAPDALKIIYISQTELGMNKSASATVKSLTKKYPDSDAAKNLGL